MSHQALHDLLQNSTQVWRGTHTSRIKTCASGYAMLDAVLPGSGWPVGALIELLPACEGIGELRLSLPALKALNDVNRQIVFVQPPHTPYPPALLRAQLSLQNILWISAGNDEDARWAAEQTLRAGAAGAVLLWSDNSDDRNLRRLQLAAETGQALAFLYRTPSALRQPSPAALRLLLQPAADGVQVEIIKARGGHTAVVQVPLC
jgi:cell division inhibitor SulA/protein ImuA